MTNVVSFDDGETIDLNTKEGSHALISRFLRKNSASNEYFSALNDLLHLGCGCKKCEEHYYRSIRSKHEKTNRKIPNYKRNY